MKRFLWHLSQSFLPLCLGLLLLSTFGGVARAQGEAWPEPRRLSSPTGVVQSDPGLVADSFGYVHLFWAEALPNERTIIQYARFDGATWSVPIDIHITPANTPIKMLAPYVTEEGTIHLLWTESLAQYLFYSRAQVGEALSAKAWLPPQALRQVGNGITMQVDHNGIIHVLFTRENEGAGVYYIYSSDQGHEWSVPYWLDPDGPADLIPTALHFLLDERDGLHAVWVYKSREENSGDWVRYTHSLDGGTSWRYPVTIARNGESDPMNAFASPVLTVQGENVHVIWAAGDLLYRHHRFSTDRGQTWSATREMLDRLNGQAGDGMAVDSLGQVHYFSHLRFPQGVYHATWDGRHWSRPNMVYFIRNSAEEDGSARIQAHRTFPVVRAGNQLVLSLTDAPADTHRGLYVMMHTLEEVPPADIVPVPTATPLPVMAGPTLLPVTVTPTLVSLPFDAELVSPVTALPSPGDTLWMALIPSVFLLGGTVVLRWWIRR